MLAAMLSGRMLVALLMGFSSGLPLLLTGSVLQAWLKDGGVDLARIGLFALIGLPYTLKFLWAPLFDRFTPVLGRRRGWLLLTQFALAGALLLLSAAQPDADHLWLVMLAFVAAFITQKLAIEREEKHLAAKFGAAWNNYAGRVRRWL